REFPCRGFAPAVARYFVCRIVTRCRLLANRGDLHCERRGRADGTADSPDEACQLTRDRGDDEGRSLAALRQGTIACGQARLGLPGNVLDVSWCGGDLVELLLADARRMAVAPGALHQNASCPMIAGLGNAGTIDRLAARSLA